MRYLLPCQTCGQSATVETSQAGQKILCDCGANLEVPSLRLIRELDPAPVTADEKPLRSWTPGRGAAFAAGLVLVILGALTAGYCLFVRSQLVLDKPPAVDVELVTKDTNSLTMEQTLEIWNEAREQGLGPYIEPMHLRVRGYHRVMGIAALIGLGLFVVGGISLGGAMLSRGNGRQAGVK